MLRTAGTKARVAARRRRFGLRALAAVGLSAALLPAGALAYAKIAPPPRYSSASGLPDGRVYELASPADKHGNAFESLIPLGLAAADGNGILWAGNGPLDENPANGSSGFGLTPYVSQRTSAGWNTRSVLPRGAAGVASVEENNDTFVQEPYWMLPSADLSHLLFNVQAADVPPPDKLRLRNNLFLAGPDPFAEPLWVGRPQLANPIPAGNGSPLSLAGGAPDLNTVYFTYEEGTLVEEDAGRAQAFGEGVITHGFYEYSQGGLRAAGVLPDGTVSRWGAVAAAQALADGEEQGVVTPAELDHQVSADGSRAFFVSPDPQASDASGVGEKACRENPSSCSAQPPELYVRETAPDGSRSTVLVSQSQLPGHAGEPAPSGPLPVPTAEWIGGFGHEEGVPGEGEPGPPSYVYASPDGSRAFFQSVDQLTSGAPNDGAPKQYVFDVDTGALEYLPGVTGSIVAVANDGSWLLFENTATAPFELDRWAAGPGGGTVTPIVQLPGPLPAGVRCGALMCVGPVRASSDGSAVVFATRSPIPGFNDAEVKTVAEPRYESDNLFRYDVPSNELSCISCPPAGVKPTDAAIISNPDQNQELNNPKASAGQTSAVDVRGMSADGSRVFFDTLDPLVPQDTDGVRDVYEWENGTIYLISSGTSTEDSMFLDSSESGSDAFFATSDELVKGDNDGAYDVYDARIPHPGDNPPPSAVPCQGDVCQGPPSVPELLGAPASATFSGVGNVEQGTEPAATPQPKKTHVASKHKQKRRSKKRSRRSARRARRSTAKKGRGK